MIAKKYRLKEREVQKVLRKGKPFFSYSLVLNRLPNRLGHARFAIVISGKSVPNAVIRNIYRRMYYELSREYISRDLGDIICVIKMKTKLSDDPEILKKIKSEILYMLDKKNTK